jgi:hypothetical protein
MLSVLLSTIYAIVMISLPFLLLSLSLVGAASRSDVEEETVAEDSEKSDTDSSGSTYSHASVCSYCVYAKVKQLDKIHQNSFKVSMK